MPQFDEVLSVTNTAALLYERLLALRQKYASKKQHRIIVAVAGVPGSGKSTITEALAKYYQEKEGRCLTVFPMDGFHYSLAALATFPDPKRALQRRGAAFTFDAEKFVRLVRRLRESPVTEQDNPALSIKAPSFDHAVKDPLENDVYFSSAEDVIILEGNYLLLDEEPWKRIAGLVDEKWFVDAPEDVAKERVVKRHLASGIESSREAAEARVMSNDLINGHTIRQHLIAPDLAIHN